MTMLLTASSLTVAPQPLFGFGDTRHTRVWPAVNAFVASTVFVRLPMRHLMSQTPQRIAGFFGVNRASPLGFCDADHGPRNKEHGSALAWVDTLLLEHGIHDATGEVWLQTFPRVMGYAFKPVSFWFCHSQSGALRAVLAEVHNTFGQQHSYLIARPDGKAIGNGESFSTDKVFHVSPFFPVRGCYTFRWAILPNRSVIRINYLDSEHRPEHANQISLTTSIQGLHQPVTALSCARVLLLYPWQSLTVVLRIHWQAAKLWFKRVSFFSLPAMPKHTVTHARPVTENHL